MQVFLKNGLVLERMAQVDAIVFDKTGTLTVGEAETVRWKGEGRSAMPEGSQASSNGQPVAAPAEGLSGQERRWVYAMARHSTHPLAVRITETLADAPDPGLVEGFEEVVGRGIKGRVEGHQVRLGSWEWVAGNSLNIQHSTSSEGSSVSLAIDGELRGAFVLANSVRPETDALLHGLGSRYDLALLSGDNEKERGRFSRLFGPGASLHFNQSPLDKLGFIQRLQESGKTVMMVGDGLNDAGALKQSDVGAAVVEKVGAFSPASDVILAARQVSRLAHILTLARHATLIVRLSFAISFLYNAVGIAIAAAGILSPLVCAILMPLSSVSVVLFACGATHLAARRAGLHKA
jgi:Cu+-exporting ATPase